MTPHVEPPVPAATADAARLAACVRGFQGRRVAVVGDLVVDEFVYGDIARVSREAPVLILDHVRTDVVPGGGANGVANLRAFGAHPLPVGVVGDDEAGRRLIARFRSRHIDVRGIVVAPGYRTPAKSRILAGGVHTRRQQVVRIDRGSPRADLPRATARAVRRALDRVLERAEGLLVADYGYGSAAPDVVRPSLERLRRRGAKIVVDSRARLGAFPGVTACTPNQEELEQALGGERLDDSSIVAAGTRLLRKTGNAAILVTRGSRGVVLFERRRPALAVSAFGSDEVADVTGAGDTVTAAFTLALLAGASFPEAARLANYAAGIVVTKAGTATVTRAELRRAIREDLE